MKKYSLLLLAFSLSMGFMTSAEAVTLRIGGPGVVFSNRQPIQVVVVDQNGNTHERTVYYDTNLGGIDLDASWAGPNASVYIPSLSTGYLWYNGFWVNQDGYYWNNGKEIYVPNIPQWRTHWTGYWQHHHYDRDWGRGDRRDRDHWWDRGDHWWNRNRDRDQGKNRDDRRQGDFNGRRFQQDGQRNVPQQRFNDQGRDSRNQDNFDRRQLQQDGQRNAPQQRVNDQGRNLRDRSFERTSDRMNRRGDRQGLDPIR